MDGMTFYEILMERNRQDDIVLPASFMTTQKLAETIDQFCRLYNVTPAQLLSESRQHHLVEIRHLCWWLAYTRLKLTLVLLGRVFNRHHTTILHGIRQIEKLMDTEPVLRDHINSVDLWLDINKSTTVVLQEVKHQGDEQL